MLVCGVWAVMHTWGLIRGGLEGLKCFAFQLCHAVSLSCVMACFWYLLYWLVSCLAPPFRSLPQAHLSAMSLICIDINLLFTTKICVNLTDSLLFQTKQKKKLSPSMEFLSPYPSTRPCGKPWKLLSSSLVNCQIHITINCVYANKHFKAFYLVSMSDHANVPRQPIIF